MTDEDVRLVIVGILSETTELGETPRARCIEYIQRTATTVEACAREGLPIAAGPLKGTSMVVVELPAEVFDRLVANDRAWRRHTGTLKPEQLHAFDTRTEPEVEH